jgi:hypothetical protein
MGKREGIKLERRGTVKQMGKREEIKLENADK